MNRSNYLVLVLSVILLGAGWWARRVHSENFQVELARQIEMGIEKEWISLNYEANRLLADTLSVKSPWWDDVSHSFFRLDDGKVSAWSRNEFLPDPESFGLDSIYFGSTGRGEFLLRRWFDGEKTLIGVITLADRFPITNSFLTPTFNKLFKTRDLTIVNPWTTIGSPINLNNRILFRVVIPASGAHETALSLFLLMAGFLLFLWSWWRIISVWRNLDLGFLLLLVGFGSVRLIMQNSGVPSLYVQSELFDPKVFASSSLNTSMGDLFLNSICLLILMLHFSANYRRINFVNWLLSRTGIARFISGVLCILACFFALLFPYNFIEVIYHNSGISLDITQSITFDLVRMAAVLSVLMAGFSSFLFFHVFYSIASSLLSGNHRFYFGALTLAALAFLGQSILAGQDHHISLWLSLLLLILLRLHDLPSNFQFSQQLFYYFISCLTVFSLQAAWSIKEFSEERQFNNQVRYAREFLTERDVLGEFLLNEVSKKIQDDPFIKARMAGPVFGISAVADKIRRVHLNSYFDRYETSIDVWPGETPGNSAPVSGFLPTGYDGVSYSITSAGNELKRYRVKIPFSTQRTAGNIQLNLTLKRIIPDNVYPELLVDNRFSQVYKSREFSYAIFKERQLVTRFGSFNYGNEFQEYLSKNELLDEGVNFQQFHHQGVEGPDGSLAVVSGPSYSRFSFAADLSFWFVLGLTILLLYQAVAGLFQLRAGVSFNYSVRIQLFIFLAFLLPVVGVSITTLTLIGRSSEESIQQDFLDRSETISQRIGNLILPDSLQRSEALEAWIGENVAPGKFDITVYSPDGFLMASSQPALFDDELVSPLMNPVALKRIVYQNEPWAVSNEHIGKLQYSCAYSAVLSPDTGKVLAIVGLPFFESAAVLQKNQKLVLSNILIVFIVVFFLFSALSFWASGSLTSPIRIISKALEHTTLTEENKPIEWNSTDEIGVLVRAYNRMVSNLDESKRALARSEKESAWREMARQVAHEIKNPLTPMKLTLQQMELSGELPPGKTTKSVEVLLKQVEILNQIASSFSSFANMPPASPQQTDLADLIRNAVVLFESQQDGEVIFKPVEHSPQVWVDPTSFSRALSNIIINAFQAKKEDQQSVRVTIDMQSSDGQVIIRIQDTGRGMTPEVKEKIFQPQFTTKQSGSGLGLALTRQIILQAGGRIWFESQPGQGSSFYIELPVIK